MITAHEKNGQAFTSMFGNGALVEHLSNFRVGVFSQHASDTVSGKLLADALGDLLGRLWRQVDAVGPLSGTLLTAASSAAASGALAVVAREGWAPPYDAVIAIGCEAPDGCGPIVRIGANGWDVTAGALAQLGDSPIPVGPAAAAALAAAEVFKIIFCTQLGDKGTSPLGDLKWNTWTLGRNGLEPKHSYKSLVLPRAHLFGTGAVTHGLLWCLERWPGEVTGTLLVIDHDVFDESNGQRYVGMRLDDVGKPKVAAIAERLTVIHPGLSTIPYQRNMNAYFDEFEPHPNVILAIVGLDSAESRRHAALKLPRRAVNMWTERHHLGSARFGGNDGWPCLMCAYPEYLQELRDETAIIHMQTGLAPERVRRLLDTGDVITAAEAGIIGPRLGISVDRITAKPLRTVLQQLCATGSVVLPESNTQIDVPFAFSSLLAGVIGFSNLVGELQAPDDTPFTWRYNTLKRPNSGLAVSAHVNCDCMLCT